MRQYQLQLFARFKGVLADDVDEYPAISAAIFSKFIEAKRPCLFTYNPQGKVRLGLGADPNALRPLAARAQVRSLDAPTQSSLGRWGDDFASWVADPAGDAGVASGGLAITGNLSGADVADYS